MSRILVIDDEHVIRMLVVEILETAGHEVDRRRERRAGTDAARRARDFDLVVSDVVMPGLSGLELLEIVRANHASLPVVLVTGAGTYETLSQALTRGAAGLVTKPFAHADLQSAVSRCARARQHALGTSCASGCSAPRSRARSPMRSRPATRTCTGTASGWPGLRCASPSCSD